MCSCIAHLTVLLLLALWTTSIGILGTNIRIESGETDSSELVPFSLERETQPTPSEDFSPSSASMPSLSESIPVPTEVKLETTTKLVPEQANQSLGEMLQQAQLSSGGGNLGFSTSSLEGRLKENRAKIALQNGGSAESERAVEMALAYLARHQANDGSWSMMFDGPPCNDQCSPSCTGLDPYRYASTGLALLCFLGAGKTITDEEYGTVVTKGIYFLQQTFRRTSGSGYWVGLEANAQMYEHGIATLALCEALQMNETEELRETCQLAINFIMDAQFHDGGWDYHPNSPGDLSIVGWQAMALKSAVAAKLVVLPKTVQSMDRFIERNRGGEFMFRYRLQRPTPSMTAIGMLLQIFRGKAKESRDITQAAAYLAKTEPSENDMYYNYYATQALFQYGDPFWKKWNYQMRDYLIRTQELQGHSAGSWWFDKDYSNKRGGRLYVTCMSCLILEVYYRYLPVYREVADDFKL